MASRSVASRLFSENQVSRPDTVEMARASIRQMAARKTDMVKIWLDGAGGLMPKLKPERRD